jgi:hypothetical protein
LKLLLAHAGKDLSCFFDKDGAPRFRENEDGSSVVIFPPSLIDDWWCDESRIVGFITSLQRRVRFINTITKRTTIMNFCEEDTFDMVKEKLSILLRYNTDKFIWRKESHSRDEASGHVFMDKTLTENGMLYQDHEKLKMPPAIWLFQKN